MRRLLILLLLLCATSVVWAQDNPFDLFILEARTDLELAANEFLGEGERPDTWTFNVDLQSDSVVPDLWFDNEQLADALYGDGIRPPEWFGATTTDAGLIARNVRHDLEISADEIFGLGERPEAWNGAPAVFRCNRTIQNLVRLLDTFYNVQPSTAQSVLDYCRALESEIETELATVIFEGAPSDLESLPDLILALRGDLERLANELLGVGSRPADWNGNVEPDSPSLLNDVASDLERLADAELGPGERPEEWAPFVPSSSAVSYRNMRFNLELLADAALGPGERPTGWQGQTALARCDTTQQTLIFTLQIQYGFVVDETLGDSDDFCELATFTANAFAENPPEEALEQQQEDSRFRAESNFAFAYLDVAALEYMGVMPGGTEFRAWYRNFNESTMMFVSGEDFALFIDRRFTTLEEDIFNTLPTLDGVRPLTFCDANWCNGPGPTPTPTGSGPLLALQQEAPQATPQGGQQGEGPTAPTQTEVSWENVRVTYLQDRPETNTVQVALEICAQREQLTCEPVVSVFDNRLGINKPVISQFNGLNVYEFPYGFNDNLVIEGQTLFSRSVWISDPTLR